MLQPDSTQPLAPPTASYPIAVLGAGVTGLAAAYRLHRAGVPVRVFEASPRVGGVIRSIAADGWLSETGPNSFQENSRSIVELLDELGLKDEKVYAQPEAKRRYLVRNRKVLPVPSSLGSFLATPLFSARTKAGLAAELLHSRRERQVDVSLAEFVSDHFGAEVVKYALNPFVSGVYAGDAARLSARFSFPSLWKAEATHGSLLRGLGAQAKAKRRRGEPKARIISFRQGLQSLPNALAAALPTGSLQVEASVHRLTPGLHGAPWRVHWKDSQGVEHSAPVRRVICTLPGHALAPLGIGTEGHYPLRELATLPSPPVTSLFLGYARSQVRHPLDGFGVLIPACENSPILGVLFSSSLFPGRAPEGHVALTVMVGGTLRPELALLDEAKLLALVQPELKALLGVEGQPGLVRKTTWTHAIPQYNLGHERYVSALETCEATYSGLFVGGQVRHGIALPQCVQAGLDLADRALA